MKKVSNKVKATLALLVIIAGFACVATLSYQGSQKVHADNRPTHKQIKTFSVRTRSFDVGDNKTVDDKVNNFLEKHGSAYVVNSGTSASGTSVYYFVTVQYEK